MAFRMRLRLGEEVSDIDMIRGRGYLMQTGLEEGKDYFPPFRVRGYGEERGWEEEYRQFSPSPQAIHSWEED